MLLDRLRFDFGVCGVTLELIASYLADRQQYVKIGQHSSTMRKLNGRATGIGARSIALHSRCLPVGDVITSVDLKYHQYADDTQLYFAVRAMHYKDDLSIIEQCTSSVQD